MRPHPDLPGDQLDRLYTLERNEAVTRAREGVLGFTLYTMPEYAVNFHHVVMARALNRFERGECRRLIITVGPRHGKSEMVSRRLPAYMLGRNPDMEIIATSYGADLAEGMSRDVQRIMLEPSYHELFPNTCLPGKGSVVGYTRTAGRFDIVGHRGKYQSSGIGGAITGKGADCVAEGTHVSTPAGARRIETLHPGDTVWSYNASRNTIEPGRVDAVRCVRSPRLVRLTFASGVQMRCTADHRIQLADGQWLAAGLLRGGDRVKAIAQQKGHLPWVQRADKKLQHDVPAVLHEGQAIDCGAAMRPVRQGVRSAALCLYESFAPQAPGLLLQHNVLAAASCHQTSPPMRDMRCAVSAQNDAILQLGVPPEAAAGADHALRMVWAKFSNRRRRRAADMFACLRRKNALAPDARNGQRTLYRRHPRPLQYLVQTHRTFDTRARPATVPGVLGGGAACAPCQPRQTRQSMREPDLTVPSVSPSAPQVTHDTVSMVACEGDGQYAVYDIQVAGNHNFFAQGILVHNCAIIDDYLRNAQDASSKTILDRQWEWYSSTLYTRLSKVGRICITATRWNENDLVGRLLRLAAKDPSADQWEVINFPAIAEGELHPDDPRALGEALWQEKYDLAALEKRKAQSLRWFTSMYQGRPSPQEGGIFKKKWWKFYRKAELPPKFERIEMACDLTTKDKEKNDNNCFLVGGALNANRYILDNKTFKAAFTRQVAAFKAMATKHPLARRKCVEDAANGAALIDHLKKEIPGIVAVIPKGSKLARAEAVSPQVESGNVFLPHPDDAPWVEGFIQECTDFPNGVHDDQVDALSMLLSQLEKNKLSGGFSVYSETKRSEWNI